MTFAQPNYENTSEQLFDDLIRCPECGWMGPFLVCVKRTVEGWLSVDALEQSGRASWREPEGVWYYDVDDDTWIVVCEWDPDYGGPQGCGAEFTFEGKIIEPEVSDIEDSRRYRGR